MPNQAGRFLMFAAFTALGLVVALTVRSRFERRTAQHRTAEARSAASDSAFADSVIRASEDQGATITLRPSGLAAPVRDTVRIARLLATQSVGTYLDAIVVARDSIVYRWPDRTGNALSVWVQEPAIPGFESTLVASVQNAFRTWSEAGVPLAFRFVSDSARADVHVTWVDRYESRTSGRTRWAHDQHDWIVGGGIELAIHQPDGKQLDHRDIFAIALHEVGHLLGLDHSPDERDIMSADVRVSELSEADVATIRLLYDLPPGSLRAP